jgi:hypothetical protein
VKFTHPLLLMLASLCLASSLPFAHAGDVKSDASKADASKSDAKTLRKSKVYRGLTASSETTRLRMIMLCRRESIHLDGEIASLLAASQQGITEAETESNIRTSTSQLLYLLGTLHEPQVESLLIDALDSPLLGIRLLSTDILGQYQFQGSIDFLKHQVSRPEYKELYGFRFNLLRAFTRMHHPDAVEFLTAIHPTLDGQLRHLIDEALNSVTVQDVLGDEDRFNKWQSRNDVSDEQQKEQEKDEIVFKTAGYESESLNGIKFANQKYYGIDIHAQRVMFIIDHSGSMEDHWGGLTRLARAKLELIKVIRELPENTEFAIMFYETNVRVWRKELLYASEQNKLEAIDFIRRLGFGDRTNTYGALRQSLSFDNDLESVFLLTDGRPTIGATVAPEKILTDILGRNRFRHLNFNTIGIAVNPTTEAFLKQLAVGSGGEYRRAL